MFFSFLQIYIFFSNRTKFTPYIYIITAFLPKYYTNKKKYHFTSTSNTPATSKAVQNDRGNYRKIRANWRQPAAKSVISHSIPYFSFLSPI